MARTTSASPGRRVRWSQQAAPVWLLLTAHLGLLSAMFARRYSDGPSVEPDVISASFLADGSTDPALLALASGLLIALFVVGTQRTRQSRMQQVDPGEPSPIAASEPTGPRALPRPGSRLARVPACESDEAYAGLMARIGHDLRTPLNALLGFSDLMKSETFGPLGNDRYRAYAAHMHSCGLDLLKATESTLAMTALLTNPALSNRDSARVIGLVDEAWAAAAIGFADHPVGIRTSISADAVVRGDGNGMHQGLVQLLCAARLRTMHGCNVEITANDSHGRVQLRIATRTAPELKPIADTNCRNRTSAWCAIDDLPLSLARTIFALQGLMLTESIDIDGRWTAVVNFEDANQSDFFELPAIARKAWHCSAARPVLPAASHSAAFLGGALSASASA